MNMKKAAGAAVVALAGYDMLVRPRMLRWGASSGEQHIQLPGDEIASGMPPAYTKAVIIEAPPEAVWPWLAQIGDHRAGFYSYDWVERFIFPGTVHYAEGTHSATRIHPELQGVHLGDRINTGSVGRFAVGNPVTSFNRAGQHVTGMWIVAARCLGPRNEGPDGPDRPGSLRTGWNYGGGLAGPVSERPDVAQAPPGDAVPAEPLDGVAVMRICSAGVSSEGESVMRPANLAAPHGGAGSSAASDRAAAKTAGRARSRTARWRRLVVLAAAVMVVLAGCGGSPRPAAGSGPAFPGTPAGAQARWLFRALGRLPIPGAAIRAHFAAAFLAQNPPAYVNARLAGAGQLRLVSVTSKRPNLVVFVMSVRGAQRFRIELPVDTHGRITNIVTQELAPTASPASVLPALAPGWAAAPVTFQAGGVTIHGTYTHPSSTPAGSIPAAVLLGGSGSATDRNDNSPGTPHCNLLQAIASWLSADRVASLRYDKLGSGQTGWGKYAAHPGRAGIKPYEQETAAALNFLARQPQVDRARLAVVGHSEGGIYALLLASGLAGPAPKVRAVGLLEPVPLRFLDLLKQSSVASLALAAHAGQITAAQAHSLQLAIARAATSLARTGMLPPGLPGGLAATFHGNGTPLELSQISRYDPAAVAAKLPPHTPVLLTCSNADGYFGCGQVNRLAAGLSKAAARLDYIHLNGVDHVLKEDITKSPAAFNQRLPFSAQLRAALKTFLAHNLRARE